MAITLNGHNTNDQAGPATSISNSFATAAGDFIICSWGYTNATGQTQTISDSVNAGNYTVLFSHSNTTETSLNGMSYMQNSVAASGGMSIAQTFSANVTGIGLTCQGWSGIATSGNVIDQSQQQDGVSLANPTSGSNLTPVGNGELVISNMVDFSGTAPTAGTNYTLLNSSSPHSGQYAEYWIQTTATATNSPYTLASDSWTDQMVFVSPTAIASGPSIDKIMAPNDISSGLVFFPKYTVESY